MLNIMLLRSILFFWLLLYRFDSIVVSCEVHYEKPDPEIFQAALERAGSGGRIAGGAPGD